MTKVIPTFRNANCRSFFIFPPYKHNIKGYEDMFKDLTIKEVALKPKLSFKYQLGNPKNTTESFEK